MEFSRDWVMKEWTAYGEGRQASEAEERYKMCKRMRMEAVAEFAST